MNGALDLNRVARTGGILLISLVGLIHLVTVPEHFKAAPYIGWSFLVLILGAGLAAVGIEQYARWG